MTRIRARLIAYVVAILVCQGAALSAAPVALCRNGVAIGEDLDECCRNLRPGQTCPMHHKTHGAPAHRGTAWTCVCSPSDAALASLVGVCGALPEPIRLLDPAPRIVIVVTLPPTPLEYQRPPTYPPPRVSIAFRLV